MDPQGAVQHLLVLPGVHQALAQQIVGDGLGAHPPGQVGEAAEGLHIHKVAPPADHLADEQAVHPHIHIAPEVLPPDPAVDGHGDDRHDHRPVNGQPAVPDGDHLVEAEGAVGVVADGRVEDHIVGPGAHNTGGHREEQHVDELFPVHAKPPRPVVAEYHRQQKAAGDDDAVPVDAPAQHGEGDGVEVKLQAEARKGEYFFHRS